MKENRHTYKQTYSCKGNSGAHTKVENQVVTLWKREDNVSLVVMEYRFLSKYLPVYQNTPENQKVVA